MAYVYIRGPADGTNFHVSFYPGPPADGTILHVVFYPDPRLTAHSYKQFLAGSRLTAVKGLKLTFGKTKDTKSVIRKLVSDEKFII